MKKFMEVLLAPNPISHRMLIAAWENLSFESQCEILLNYREIKGSRLVQHWKEIASISIKSPYPLIRYLASKLGHINEEEVRNDPHPLVSASNMTFGMTFSICSMFEDVDNFISLNQAVRIEKLSNCSDSSGKFFCFMSSIKKSMEKGLLENSEVFEILMAYLTNPYVKRAIERDFSEYRADMGYDAYCDSKERDCIWKLTLLFPDQWDLPTFFPIIPEGETINKLEYIVDELIDGKYWLMLQTILNRKDLKEEKFRLCLNDELMKAVRKDEVNRFFGIELYDAVSLLRSFNFQNQSWDEIHDKINCFFSDTE